MTDAKKIRGWKGFDANLQCRGFQFSVGQTYTHDGPVKACYRGFHAIPEDAHPLSIFRFYAPAGSRFCLVEVSGATDRDDDKIAAEILSVQKEIGLSDIAAEAVAWVMARSTPEGEAATGYQGAASATGYQGAASATGDQGAASATGWQGKVTGSAGNALFAVERDEGGNILSVACGIAGKDVPADTWLRCVGGKLIEVTE